MQRQHAEAQKNHCTLCGIRLAGMKRRLFCVADGGNFIVKRCKVGPFLYPVLANSSPAEELGDANKYLCIPCVNWKRRAERGRLRRTAQPMLQLDQLLLYLMQPGRFHEPDHRCMTRLIVAVRQPDNIYRHIFPAPVQWIIQNIEGNTYPHCVAAWWKYNERTEFFSYPQEAKRVRCAVKAGLVEEVLDASLP